jgi:hypothetical protein
MVEKSRFITIVPSSLNVAKEKREKDYVVHGKNA